MALVKGSNSYLSVTEASVYFDNRLDVDAWTSASDSMKAQALVTASLLLNNLDWLGTILLEDQLLAFPRNGYYYDPLLGYDKVLTSETPRRVLDATCELAYHILNNDGVLDDTGMVKDLAIGDIKLSISNNPSKIPAAVRVLVRPLLRSSGRNWWRAN